MKIVLIIKNKWIASIIKRKTKICVSVFKHILSISSYLLKLKTEIALLALNQESIVIFTPKLLGIKSEVGVYFLRKNDFYLNFKFALLTT